MIQLNLLPDVKKEFLHAKAMQRNAISISIIVTIASVGILIALGFFLVGQKALIASKTGGIEERANELAEIENVDEYLTIQAQLAQIDGLHATKLNTSRLLDILPRLNPSAPNSVRFASVDITAETSTIEFQGGVKNVSALTTFKDTLENAQISYQSEGSGRTKEPLFNLITISEYGYSSNTENKNAAVGFTILAEYNPNLFATTSKNLNVSVPNRETTQSVVGAPKVTFEKDAGSLEENDE